MSERSPMGYLQRYLVEEMVEEYREARINRRELIHRVLRITGSIPAAAAILLQLGCGASATGTTAASASGATAATTSGAPATASSGASPTAAPTAAATASSATASSSGATSASSTAAEASTSRAATVTESATATGSPAATSAAAPSGVTVSPDDPAIDAGAVTFAGQVGMLKGYRAAPRAVAKAPGLIVIHENRGLTEHIKDVARRYAKAGYLTVAADLVSRQGGADAFADASEVTAILGRAKPADLVQDLLSGVAYLKSLPAFAGPKAGVVGYCFGGGLTWLLAINSPDLAAAVPYYGPPPQPLDDVQKVGAAVLAFYGGKDTRITSSEPAMQAAMAKYGKTFAYHIYPEAGHAFNNDTGPSYDAAAAKDAFLRALAWFHTYLGPTA